MNSQIAIGRPRQKPAQLIGLHWCWYVGTVELGDFLIGEDRSSIPPYRFWYLEGVLAAELGCLNDAPGESLTLGDDYMRLAR